MIKIICKEDDCLDIKILKEAYEELSWFQKWFFPTSLGRALNAFNIDNPESEQIVAVTTSFMDIWFFQKWFFPCLTLFSYSNLIRQIKSANNELVIIQTEEGYDNSVDTSEKNEYWDLLGNTLSADEFQRMYKKIEEFDTTKQLSLLKILRLLKQNNLLNGQDGINHFNTIWDLNHKCRSKLGLILEHLNKANILTQGNFEAVSRIRLTLVETLNFLQSLNEFLNIIEPKGLLNNHVYDILGMSGYDLMDVINSTRILNAAGLLDGEKAQHNLNIIIGQYHIWHFAKNLMFCYTYGLLHGEDGQINFDIVSKFNDVDAILLHTVLICIQAEGFISRDVCGETEESINSGRMHLRNLLNNSAVLIYARIWTVMPYGFLTIERLNHLVRIAEQHRNTPEDGRRAVEDYVNRELNIAGIEDPETLNNNQSTHTASINESSSASASALRDQYGKKLNDEGLDKVIEAFSDWFKELPDDSLKKGAAKRGFSRITAPDYTHFDEVSGVSTKELLALIWLAIHDDKERIGALDDALNMLIDGFYECQRGYNISTSGRDNGAADRPICVGGTFNKLIEKNQGVLKSIQLIYMTMTSATLKLKCVVNEEIVNFIKTSEDSKLLSDFSKSQEMALLWPHISKPIAVRIFEEFAPLFRGGKESEAFTGFISSGKDIELNPSVLKRLKERIEQINPLAERGHAVPGFFSSPVSNNENNSAAHSTLTL